MDKNAFLIALSESDRTDFGRVEFSDQSEEQQVFSAIWELESQVNNGGFAQYFQSEEGYTANTAPSALRAIGAVKCADLVRRALAMVTVDGLPDDQSAREQLIEVLDTRAQEALEALDQEFMAYPDNLTDLLFEYVRLRPHAFGPVSGTTASQAAATDGDASAGKDATELPQLNRSRSPDDEANMDRWTTLADRLLAPATARFGSNALVLEYLGLPAAGVVDATDLAELCRCTAATTQTLTTLLEDPRHRHAVHSLVVAARCVPDPLLRPMLLAAARTLNPSANRKFVEPCILAFGRRRVVSTLLSIAANESSGVRAGAVNALYWAWAARESLSWPGEEAAPAPFPPDEPVEDLRAEFMAWAVREFVVSADLDVRRALASTLIPARRYEPELAERAIAMARGDSDPYVRQRIAADLGESRLLPCLPSRSAG